MSDEGQANPIRATRVRRHLRGSRVLCGSHARVLLVQHVDPQTAELFWLLPGGGREPAETFEQTALREIVGETGVEVRLVRRLRVPAATSMAYAIFLAELVTQTTTTATVPTVDLSAEPYLRGAGWHPITEAQPLGPLNPRYWAFLTPLLRRLAVAGERSGLLPRLSSIW